MKKALLSLGILLSGLSMGQISVNESFDTTPGSDKGFTVAGFSSSATPSGCTTRALSKNFWATTSNNANTIVYASMASDGKPLKLSFKYKHPKLGVNATVNGTLKVEYAIDGGAYNLLDTMSLTTSEQFCKDYSKTLAAGVIPAGKEFKLKITGTYLGGDFYIVIDDFVIVQKDEVLAVDNSQKEALTVFPNPAVEVVNLSSYKSVTSIMVTDYSGKIVRVIKEPKKAISVSDLKTGNYIINIITNDGEKKAINFIKKINFSK